jgi:hypothetical protein
MYPRLSDTIGPEINLNRDYELYQQEANIH